jgi:ferric-chelate reductase [NAD(P)H]
MTSSTQSGAVPSESNPLIDLQSLFNIQYGMYVISSFQGDGLNGQIATTVMQVTNEPIKLTACLSKETLTHDMIVSSRVFGISVLDTTAGMDIIGCFGFRSGHDYDKFQQVPYTVGQTGCPLLKEHVVTVIEARVIDIVDVRTHTLFVGDVVLSRQVGDGDAMTYEYYHKELKGRSPTNAPTYHISRVVSHDSNENKKNNKETL